MFQAPDAIELPVPVWDEPPPLPRRKKRRWRRRVLVVAIWLSIWTALVLAGVVLWCARDLPRPEAGLHSARRPTLILTDSDDAAFASLGDRVGEPMHLADLPAYLPAALVAIEDRRFYDHGGLDWLGILRASLVNARAGHVVQGGSTLTQQVAKTLFLSNARTFRRKVQEVLLTLWLEHQFSKQELLEIYLNRVYLGHHAWGFDAAAHTYFGKSARALTLGEAAVLAGLPKAPSRLNPLADPAAARARAKVVLDAMADTGAITPATADAAAASLSFAAAPARQVEGGDPALAWYSDWAANDAERVLPEGTDARLRTTLDFPLQRVASARLEAALARPGFAGGAGQGAIVALDPATGAVLAMVGGRVDRGGPFNRATEARRQPGSAMKPFVWLAAMDAAGLTPDSTVLDAPIDWNGWTPNDFDGRFRGTVTLEDGLAESLNTVAVRLEQLAGGPAAVAAMARKMGIDSPLGASPTIALGTANVGVLEMAASYGAFFDGGLRATPTAVGALSTPGGAIPVPAATPVRVLPAERAAQMLRMMTAVVARGSGRAAGIAGRIVAGKTGTTQDGRDAWFVGGVLPAEAGGRALVIAVWIGRDDDRPIPGLTGGGLPAQIFHDVAAAWVSAPNPQQARTLGP